MNFLIKISTLSGKSWTTNWVKQIGIWKVPPLPKNSVCVLWRNRHRHRLMGVFQFFVRPLDRGGTLRCCSRQQCGRGAFEAAKGSPHFKKVQFFFNIVQKAFAPPPFYLNICPILRGVFFNNVETDMKYM